MNLLRVLVHTEANFAIILCKCMPQHVTSCAAAREFLLPNFYKNAVVPGEKFASN